MYKQKLLHSSFSVEQKTYIFVNCPSVPLKVNLSFSGTEGPSVLQYHWRSFSNEIISLFPQKKQTPLHLAASSGQESVCALLLDLGASLDSTGLIGMYFIHRNLLLFLAQSLIEINQKYFFKFYIHWNLFMLVTLFEFISIKIYQFLIFFEHNIQWYLFIFNLLWNLSIKTFLNPL